MMGWMGVGVNMGNGYFRGFIILFSLGRGFFWVYSLDCCYCCFWVIFGGNNKIVFWVDIIFCFIFSYRESSYL